MPANSVSRRTFLRSAAVSAAGMAVLPRVLSASASTPEISSLGEFTYGEVSLHSELHEAQLKQCRAVLMGLSEDSMLKPIRQMGGLPAPGDDMGGWYTYVPNSDWQAFDLGFAPAHSFGQWVSALSRMYAIDGNSETQEKVLRLNRLWAKAMNGGFYEKHRYPAYCYDKVVCGLIDAHRWVGDPEAFSILNRTTDLAMQQLPKTAIEGGKVWRPGRDVSYTWDESYTISENLFLAYQRGAGERYRELGVQYLDDEYYGPLSEGKNVLAGKHAYSHVNSLSSAMQAYLTTGSEKHLRAAKNGFDMITAQSFATGGWGPDEQLRAPGSGDVEASLTKTHNSFETPCGAYGHFKITRYLLRVTREARYGDSMERVMYNTVLGAKPLEADGRTFYYSDYNFEGKKVYSPHRWPCCSGTLPQISADYRISTYFRDRSGVYVNLYIPSTVRWSHAGSQISITQESGYPNDGTVELVLSLSKPTEFALNLRIPAWAEGASVAVNGKRVTSDVVPGNFALVRREWKNGDRVELDLPMKTRLETIDKEHPDTVALLRGPLVLFAVTTSAPNITRAQVLATEKAGEGTWRVTTDTGPMTMLPFTAIADEQYSTYLRVSA